MSPTAITAPQWAEEGAQFVATIRSPPFRGPLSDVPPSELEFVLLQLISASVVKAIVTATIILMRVRTFIQVFSLWGACCGHAIAAGRFGVERPERAPQKSGRLVRFVLAPRRE